MAGKKKWYETWWGLLWTLALTDANPGRGLRVFMEVDRELGDLEIVENEGLDREPYRTHSKEASETCLGASSATCSTS
jgi:hypothetical protein